MKNHEKLLIIVGVLLVVGIGISFAYFSTKVNSSGIGASTTATTVTKGDTNITTEGVIEFNDLNIYPGHSNISKIKVTATGDQEVLYNLIWTGTNTLNTSFKFTVYKTTTNETPSITCTKHEEGSLTKIYYETCTNNNLTNLGEAISTGEITTTSTENKFKLIKNETLQATKASNTLYYYIVLEYPNLDESQNIDINGTFTGTTSIELLEEREIDSEEFIARSKILSNKTISTRTDFSTTLTEDTTGTIYTVEDDDGTSYYFAGAPTDNWVKFAEMYWRIIRINGDGTVRLLLADNVDGTQFNPSGDDNMYVGYMYTSGSAHGLGTDSDIKGILDSWYDSNLASFASDIDTNAGFCGDRTPYTSNAGTSSGGGIGNTTTYYGAYIRLITNKEPSFKCTYSEDLYTLTSSSKGNKALTNPIGLITADEVAYAGGVYNTENADFYLASDAPYWTISPSWHDGDAFVFYVNLNEGLTDTNTISVSDAIYGVRPVINLRSDTQFIEGGTGTVENPYVVQ